MPPAVAISRLSVSICRMIRPRPAPSAALIAASRPRAAARARSRLAVFTQAIRSSNPTAASITINDGRTRAGEALLQPHEPGRQLVGPDDVRKRGAERAPDRFRFARRLLRRDPRSQPADDGVVEAAAGARQPRTQRHEEIGGIDRVERRQHAHHRVGLVGEQHRRADHVRARVEAASPERVGEHDHVGAALDVQLARERSAERGLNPEDLEVLLRHRLNADESRAVAAHQFIDPAPRDAASASTLRRCSRKNR